MNTEKNIQEISYQLIIDSCKLMKSFLVHAIVELDKKFEEMSSVPEYEENYKKISELEMMVENFDILIEKLEE